VTDDLDRLLGELCDGTLNDADRAALGDRLAADASARSRYLDYLDLHAALAGPMGVALPELAEPATQKRSVRRYWIPAVVLAAMAVVGVVLLFPKPQETAPNAVPDLAAIQNMRLVEFGGRAEVTDETGTADATEGDAVKPGQTLRTDAGDGYAVLDFGRGSWLQLSPDAQLRFADTGLAGAVKVVLLSGILRGEVSKSDDLTVVTPGGEFHPSGARFLISASVPHEMVTEGESVSPVKAKAVFPNTFVYWGLGFTGETTVVARLKSSQYGILDVATQTAGPPRPVPAHDCAAAGLSGDGSTSFTIQRSGRAAVLDTDTASLRTTFDVGDAWRWVWAISNDGSTMAGLHQIPGPPVEVRFWNTTDGLPRPAAKPSATPRCLALSVDGKLAAWGLEGKRKQSHFLEIWDVAAGKMLATAEVPEKGLRTLAFAPDGQTLAGATEAGAVHRWDCATGVLAGTYLPADSTLRPVSALAFSADGSRLAVGRGDGRAAVWNVESGREILSILPGTRTVTALAFSPSGRSLAVGLLRQPTTVWTVPTE
jgi:hypothetical protein